MSTRVYVPSTIAGLRQLLLSGGVGPVPVRGYAVTDELRSGLPGAGEEELEYVALTAAAQESLGLPVDRDPPRRVVVVAEADSVTPVTGAGGVVEIDEVLPLRRVVAVHVDAAEADADVTAARAAWAAAQAGDEAAEATVERCLDHEPGWFATQEIGDLVTPR